MKLVKGGVLPWNKVKKSEGEKFSLFWCIQSNTDICTDSLIKTPYPNSIISVSLFLCTTPVYVHQKRENFSPLLFFTFVLRQHPPLTNFITYPHCFGTAFISDVTSKPNSRERRRSCGFKKPRPLLLPVSTGFKGQHVSITLHIHEIATQKRMTPMSHADLKII